MEYGGGGPRHAVHYSLGEDALLRHRGHHGLDVLVAGEVDGVSRARPQHQGLNPLQRAEQSLCLGDIDQVGEDGGGPELCLVAGEGLHPRLDAVHREHDAVLHDPRDGPGRHHRADARPLLETLVVILPAHAVLCLDVSVGLTDNS